MKLNKGKLKSATALLLVFLLLLPGAQPLVELAQDMWDNFHIWVDFERPDGLDGIGDAGISDNTGTNTEEVDDGSKAPVEEESGEPQDYHSGNSDAVQLEALGVKDAVLVSYDDTSRTYKTGEEDYVTILGGVPTTYLDSVGKLQLIDNTLVDTGDGVTNRANSYGVTFPYTITGDAGITVVYEGYRMEMIPLDGNFKTPVIQDNIIRYNDAYKRIDVQYTVIGDSIKEDIIVLEPSEKRAFSYVINAEGLQAEIKNNILCLYPQGKTIDDMVLKLSAPMMEDAAGAVSLNIQMSLEERDGQTILTVTPDEEWLSDVSRQYPVRIDPTITTWDADGNRSFHINGTQERQPSISTEGYEDAVYLGFDSGNGTGTGDAYHKNCRVYIKFYDIIDTIPKDARITKATFSISHYTAISGGKSRFDMYYVNRTWGKYIYWESQDKDVTVMESIDSQYSSPYPHTFITFDISKAVNNWVQDVWPFYSLMIKGHNEGDDLASSEQCEVLNNYTSPYQPQVVIEWSDPGDPFLLDYPVDDTTIVLRPLIENNANGMQIFDALFVDGLATAGATVEYGLYENGTTRIGTSMTTTAEGEYAYPDSTAFTEIFENAKPIIRKDSNWQSTLLPVIDFDTIYQVKAKATTTVDGVAYVGKEAVSDTFLIYLVKDYDTLPRIAQHYGVSIDTLMEDNAVRDTLAIAGNTLFIRNPKTDEPYNPSELTITDMKQIDRQLIGRGLHCEFGFEPINLNTGNFYMDQNDVSLNDLGGSFDITRTYNSLMAEVNSMFGRGWSFSYDQALYVSTDGEVIYKRADGSYLVFTQKADGSYQAPEGYVYELTPLATEEGGWKLTDASQTTYIFDRYGMLLSVTDVNGYVTKLSYNDSYGLESITTPSGKVFRVTVNEQGYITKITLPDKHFISYSYDADGNLVAVTNENGDTRSYQYDDKHQMTSWADENGNTVIINTYDDKGRVVKQTDANGGVVTLIYGENTTTTIDCEGNKTVYTYDEYKRTIRIDYPDESVTKKTYNDKNQLLTETTAKGTKCYTYDKFGNVATETREDGAVAIYTYNDKNKLVKVVGYEGGTVVYEYDDAGNLIRCTQPDGAVASYTYDEFHRMLSQTDGRGITTTYTYEGANLISYTDGEGHTWSFTYDAMNRQLTATDPLGNTTSYTYNANGDKTSETAPDGGRTTYQLDKLGNILTSTDAKGNTTTYTYDDMYNVIKVTDPTGNVVTYTYNKNNVRTSTTDALGNTITYTIDCMGRVAKEESKAHGVRLYEYDLAGNVVKVTDAYGEITTSEYNTQGLVTKTTDALGNVTQYLYNALGKETEVIYADGSKVPQHTRMMPPEIS